MSADRTVGRVSYTFRSPVSGFADRDFYLQQLIRWDYPTPGAVSMHVSSLEPSDECPINPKKVRAKVYIIGFIMTPFKDPITGEEHTQLFGANSVDPSGLIPKWVINMTAKAAI